LAWRWHISNFPEGTFGVEWLFNQGNIRFTPSFFYWLVVERMNKLIFSTGFFVFFCIGIMSQRSKKEGFFYDFYLLAIVIFFIIIAKGNVTHDYYQLPIVPI